MQTRRAYIVSGPVSSGNRTLAAILVRSGCRGEGSHRQPQTAGELLRPGPKGAPCVIIKHGNLAHWCASLRAIGWERVTVLILVREPEANARSMVKHRHCPDLDTARRLRVRSIRQNLNDATFHADAWHIVTYEGLTEEALRVWLPTIGLDYVAGPLSLPGQNTPRKIANQNAKHYRAAESKAA